MVVVAYRIEASVQGRGLLVCSLLPPPVQILDGVSGSLYEQQELEEKWEEAGGVEVVY